MRVFILWDESVSSSAYPVLGLYTTLEKAIAAAFEDTDLHGPPTNLAIYEDETDQVYDDRTRPPFEPVYHRIPERKP